ncbi:DUF6417 family protein [Streptomyces sp. NPDC048436]|uniref:DUF6417 family protein n=1 Tax=Streptomyces sp. NPDC048436 TaxID=3365550 RepID=UPI00371B766E
MGRSAAHDELLRRVAAGQGTTDGWATAAAGLDERVTAPLVRLGLARVAPPEDQAELSAQAGRPVLWAVQLTDDGWDVLLYAQARATSAAFEAPVPGLQKVALRRSDLDIVKRFLAVGGRLRRPPAPGLEAAVDAARYNAASNRWIVYVNGEQMRSMARAFFLERLAGSAAPGNRFARVYGEIYPPRRLSPAREPEHGEAR